MTATISMSMSGPESATVLHIIMTIIVTGLLGSLMIPHVHLFCFMVPNNYFDIGELKKRIFYDRPLHLFIVSPKDLYFFIILGFLAYCVVEMILQGCNCQLYVSVLSSRHKFMFSYAVSES